MPLPNRDSIVLISFNIGSRRTSNLVTLLQFIFNWITKLLSDNFCLKNKPVSKLRRMQSRHHTTRLCPRRPEVFFMGQHQRKICIPPHTPILTARPDAWHLPFSFSLQILSHFFLLGVQFEPEAKKLQNRSIFAMNLLFQLIPRAGHEHLRQHFHRSKGKQKKPDFLLQFSTL